MQIKEIIDRQNEKLNDTLATIESIQLQLNELKQSLRVDQQLAQAQKTAENEVNKWLKDGVKLFKDCASVFPIEFLDGIEEKIQDLTAEVKDNYNELSQSDRFLNADIEDNGDIPLMPLIASQDELKQIELVIDDLSESDFRKLKIITDISVRITTRNTVAKLIKEKMNLVKLTQIIESFKTNLLLLETGT
jgi:FtsZ-binding cell division protein ZapB